MLATALALRVAGAFTDYPWYWYPDRDIPVHARACINIREPRLNPGEFIYPTGYVYLNAAVYGLVGAIAVATGLVDGVEGLGHLYYSKFGFLMGVTRIVGSVLSAAGIYLLFRLGQSVDGKLVGWLAAATMTFAWLDIVCCHYPTADAPSAFMLLATVAWAWRLHSRPAGRREYFFGGLLAGAAAATKYPAGAGLVSLLAAHFLAGRNASDPGEHPRRPPPIQGTAILVLSSALGFLILCPWAVLDWPNFVADMVYQSVYNASGPEAAWQVGRFFFGMTPVAGLGAPLNIFAIFGLAWLAARRLKDAAVLLSGPTVLFLSYVATHRFMPRWYETVMPFVCLGVALGAAATGRALGRIVARPRLCAWAAAAVLATCLIRPTAMAVHYDWILRQPGTRRQATAWIADHIPPGAHVVLTQWRWASPDVPEDKYQVTWLVAGSPERLYTGLRLKTFLNGPWGRRLQRFAPRGFARLRQRQELFLAAGDRPSDLLPDMPGDAEWAIVNESELARAAANAPGPFEPVRGRRYEAFGPMVQRWASVLLASLRQRAEQSQVFASTPAEEHPWGPEPYGSPTLVIFRLVPARPAGPERSASSASEPINKTLKGVKKAERQSHDAARP